jgi:hypothetical protein
MMGSIFIKVMAHIIFYLLSSLLSVIIQNCKDMFSQLVLHSPTRVYSEWTYGRPVEEDLQANNIFITHHINITLRNTSEKVSSGGEDSDRFRFPVFSV